MFFVVTLNLKNNSRRNVCIPMHWCLGIDMQSVYNGGVDKRRNLKIFFSKQKSRIPNFNLPIRDEFVDEDACYIARYRTCESKPKKEIRTT